MTGFRSIVTGILLLLAAVPVSAPGARAGEPLVLAVLPYLPATEIFVRFRPLADILELTLDRDISISVSKDYAVHERRVGMGEVDIAYMGPAAYVKTVEQYGPLTALASLVIKGNPTFKGYIVTTQDGPVQSLDDVRGRSFAFGDPESTMSHLVPRYMLHQAGITVEELSGYEFLGSHRNVALGVLIGKFDVGAVKEEVYFEYQARGLRAVAETPALYEHLFVATKRLDATTADKIKTIMLGLAEEDGGQPALTSIKKNVSDLGPVIDGDYDRLREILAVLKRLGLTE